MGVADKRAEGGDGSQIAVVIESGVIVDEVIVEITEEPVAISHLRLHRIFFENVERAGKIQTPAEGALVADDRTFHRNIAEDRSKLDVADVFVLPPDIESAVGRMIDGAGIAVDRGVDFRA